MPIPSLGLPNIKLGKEIAKSNTEQVITVVCQSCKKPLWDMSELVEYGTKKRFKKIISYEGVPEYNSIWTKDESTCSECLCWFCGEPHLKIIKDEHGNSYARPSILGE